MTIKKITCNNCGYRHIYQPICSKCGTKQFRPLTEEEIEEYNKLEGWAKDNYFDDHNDFDPTEWLGGKELKRFIHLYNRYNNEAHYPEPNEDMATVISLMTKKEKKHDIPNIPNNEQYNWRDLRYEEEEQIDRPFFSTIPSPIH